MLNIPRRIALLALTTAAVWLAACGGPDAPAPSAQGNAPQESQYLEVPRVSLEEAKSALDAGSAIFLDVRSQQSYESQHIPGALNIPLPDMEARLGELDKAEWIITYCT
jgi:3-mercaptopyruvate sulfurtransferase SseA